MSTEVRAGQIWRFSSLSGLVGDCEIIEVDGYGGIRGRFYDNIGNEVIETVKEDDFDYLVADEGRLAGDPEIDDEPLED